jgi:hypothetical protein
MLIKVSAKDIEQGNLAKSECPITIALRKKFGANVSVSRDFIRYRKKRSSKIVLVPLPKSAQNFLLDTIGPATLAPFSFKLSTEAVKKLRG